MKRVFVAINLPKEIRKKLSDFQNEIKNCFPNARLVSPKNLHITLAFLGEITPQKTELSIKTIQEAVKELRPFSLFLAGLDVFPTSLRAKVLWVDLKDGAILKILNQTLYRKLSNEGFLLDNREFNPHITLARFWERPEKNKLLLFLKNFQVKDFGEIKVKSIEVMKSELTKKGPVYKVIEDIKLKCQMKNKKLKGLKSFEF